MALADLEIELKIREMDPEDLEIAHKLALRFQIQQKFSCGDMDRKGSKNDQYRYAQISRGAEQVCQQQVGR